MNDYRQLATDVVAELKRQGADACDVFVASTTDFSTEVRLGRIEKLEQSISKGLGMRVFKGGAMALTYTTDFNDKSVKSIAAQALDIVKVSNPDEFNGLAPRESLGVCDGTDGREVFYATVAEVIVPRLEAFGLGARDAWKNRLAV